MKHVPFLFSTPMVIAAKENRKTNTRRTQGLEVVNEDDPDDWEVVYHSGYQFTFRSKSTGDQVVTKAKAAVGDVIWVRETWAHTEVLNLHPEDENYGYVYKADGQPWEDYEGWTWKPSIHMPKAAARLFLEVTDVRVERLQDISEQDAIAEGVERLDGHEGLFAYKSYVVNEQTMPCFPYVSFRTLWQSINGRESWEANPWVFVYQFKRVEK